MSERKVLNKYYPPDFDPTKIPKIRRPKNYKAGVFNIRLMAPFNMRCNTCGEYIYKGKKFNSRKETVENENYLGLHIFRFYIKCPRCIAEIAFKTDPVNTDYELEAGATRNFEATRTAEKMALQEQKEKEAEEAGNPMKLLENRTKASCQEMEMLETLEDLRELRHRHAGVDVEKMLQQNRDEAARLLQLQEREDEEFVKSIFGRDGTGILVKRIDSDDDADEDAAEGDGDTGDDDDVDDDASSRHSSEPVNKISRLSAPTDILTDSPLPATSTSKAPNAAANSDSWNRSVGSMKCSLSGLVRPKAAATSQSAESNASSADRSTASTGQADERKHAVVDGVDKKEYRSTAGVTATAESSGDLKSLGLAGLGAYSSSSGADSDSDNA